MGPGVKLCKFRIALISSSKYDERDLYENRWLNAIFDAHSACQQIERCFNFHSTMRNMRDKRLNSQTTITMAYGSFIDWLLFNADRTPFDLLNDNNYHLVYRHSEMCIENLVECNNYDYYSVRAHNVVIVAILHTTKTVHFH